MLGGELTTNVSVEQIVDAYQNALKTMERCYKEIEDAQDVLFHATGGYSRSLDLVGHRQYGWSSHNDEPRRAEYIKEIVKRLNKEIWQTIFERIGIKKLLTAKRVQEYEKNIQKGNMPPITTATIFEQLTQARDGAAALANEKILEAYDILTPGPYEQRKYKTNGRYALDKKVIKTGYISSPDYGRGFRVYGWSRYAEERLRAIDNAFHLLDGQGVPDGYVSELVDAINSSGEAGTGKTKYFKFSCFKNGNLHLWFLRPDLVERMNAMAGDGSLTGEE